MVVLISVYYNLSGNIQAMNLQDERYFYIRQLILYCQLTTTSQSSRHILLSTSTTTVTGTISTLFQNTVYIDTRADTSEHTGGITETQDHYKHYKLLFT